VKAIFVDSVGERLVENHCAALLGCVTQECAKPDKGLRCECLAVGLE